MKFEIFKYESVTSTNDAAIDLIKKKNKEKGCVYADIQTKGRGTQGKKWISDRGNLFGSIFFPLKENYPPFNEFSIINPVLISEVLKYFCNKKNVSFKWPNDVMLSGKKICGILQEVISLNKKQFLIIGIGINIVSNPVIEDKYGATNIFFETKQKPTVKQIISQIILFYQNFFVDLESYNYINFKKKADIMSFN